MDSVRQIQRGRHCIFPGAPTWPPGLQCDYLRVGLNFSDYFLGPMDEPVDYLPNLFDLERFFASGPSPRFQLRFGHILMVGKRGLDGADFWEDWKRGVGSLKLGRKGQISEN